MEMSSILILLVSCASSWSYYKEICYEARSHEGKIHPHDVMVSTMTCPSLEGNRSIAKSST